jgi:scyllo-inositol 2-dehydrogenase (NADP+)
MPQIAPPINVAILGFGLSGSTFHAPLLQTIPDFKITHIFARQIEDLQQQYPALSITVNLEDILNDPAVDLVINTLPNPLHYSITKQCLLAGKNVVVEKPFVTDSWQGEELITLAQEKNLLLSVYHNRRWDNGYLTLQDILPQLGEVFLYEAYFDRFRPIVQSERWKEQISPGSGLLYDLGSHLIDQALNLFGMPEAVFADVENQRAGAQVADYFNLTLFYGKRRVILGSSSMIAKARPTLAVYGDRGSYVKVGLDTQEANLRSGMLPNQSGYGVEDSSAAGALSIQIGNGISHHTQISLPGDYCAYYRQIHAALRARTQAPVSAESALNVIKIIELAQLSQQKRQIIEIT